MAVRGEDAEGLPGERQMNASNAAGSLYMPWQAISALAAETGQAVRQTFTDSGVGTSGRVQQSAQKSYSSANGLASRDPSHQPEVSTNSDQVSAAQWKAKTSPGPGFVDPEAVQADMRMVRRKMLSTDAATEVVLRFNFLSGPESRVSLHCFAEPVSPSKHALQSVRSCVVLSVWMQTTSFACRLHCCW